MSTSQLIERNDDTHLSRAADQIVESLLSAGIRHVFICPGSSEAAFLHAAAQQDELEIILTTHEGIAVSMADGLARETGQPTAAYLHANVGLTNGLSHVSAAQLAYSPVILLTGLKQTRLQGRGGFTTAPYMRDFVRQYTKWAWQSLRADQIPFDITRAIQRATTVPSGPTWVGLAQDLVEEPVRGGVQARSTENTVAEVPSSTTLQYVNDLILEAARPALVVGGDLSRGGTLAVESAIKLAEKIQAPIYVEDRRGFERTVISSKHCLYAGLYDPFRPSVQSTDLLIFLGAKAFTEFEVPTQPEIPEKTRVIHVHSAEEEVGKIYGADVAIVGDAGAVSQQLLSSIDFVPVDVSNSHIEMARAENTATRQQFLDTSSSPEGFTTVGQVMSVLGKTLSPDHIVVGDATTSGKALIYAVEEAGADYHTTSSGSLGWGVGAALGVKIAKPEKSVLAVCGDGAFQFGLAGLWTAARYQIPVTYVIINNSAYAAVGAAIKRFSGEVTERERDLVVDLRGPTYSEIARGFGVQSTRVTSATDLMSALQKAENSKSPYLIEVMTDPNDYGP